MLVCLGFLVDLAFANTSAAIQGKDCLIQKFRNSSVMLEHPSFRPLVSLNALHVHAHTNLSRSWLQVLDPMLAKKKSSLSPIICRRWDEVLRMQNMLVCFALVKSHSPHKDLALQDSLPEVKCHLLPLLPIRLTWLQQSSTSFIFSHTFLSFQTFNLNPPHANLLISIGLFAPRQGQVYREEQRRRRSQFDRGTPGAEFEALTQGLTDPALSAQPTYEPLTYDHIAPISTMLYAFNI